MGKVMILRGVKFTDTTGPKIITRDKIESDGSLMLFDGNHQFGQFSGLPGVNASVPNALSSLTAKLLSVSEDLTHLKGYSASADSAGLFKKERTAKGGIHGIVTQAGGQTSVQAYFLRAPDAVQAYMRDNNTHTFYVSLWQRVTRKALDGPVPQAPFYFANGVSSTANFRFHMEGSLPYPRAGTLTSRGVKAVPVANDINIADGTNRFTSLGVQGNTGNGPISADPVTFGVGTIGAWNGGNYNKAASRIIYRAYIEDLTVSGRTYAEVEAIDYALYQEAFAPGGKFYGDTYTAPSTLP